jgi:hypothetical protein
MFFLTLMHRSVADGCLLADSRILQKETRTLDKNNSCSYLVGNGSSIFMLSSDDQFVIRRSENIFYDDEVCGVTPDVSKFGRSDGTPANFTFTAVTDTHLTITYGDIGNFKCDLVIVDDSNPFMWAATRIEARRTCIVVAMGGEQAISGTMERCEICPVVDVYSGSNARIVRLTGPSSFDGKSNDKEPLVVVISAPDAREPDFDGFHFTVTSDGHHYENQSHVEWSSPWRGNPQPENVHVCEIGNILALAGIGGMGFLVVLMSARILYTERIKRKQQHGALNLGSLLMFSRSVTYFT